MNELMKNITERRSIRNYLETPIPDEMLSQVLEAVRWSPSWANTQCWEVIVVKDPETRAALGETLAKGNPGKKAILKAPVVLVICGRLGTSGFYNNVVTTKFGDWFMFDLGIATQSLCLCAQSLGLGTLITGLFDHDKAKALLNVPEGCELVSMIPIGYPERGTSAPKRRELSEFVHTEAFGRKG
ncbi:MAG: nitroreductase family protein [Deltaproteobacteria bacterium]|nr:nitroreductase family protein [Deltaproteobacteria bacterium]